MMTIKGGNGTIAAGSSAHMTLDLDPGHYFVLDNPQNEYSPTDEFTVVEDKPSTVEPTGMIVEFTVWTHCNRRAPAGPYGPAGALRFRIMRRAWPGDP
jgi:hypothetical protein